MSSWLTLTVAFGLVASYDHRWYLAIVKQLPLAHSRCLVRWLVSSSWAVQFLLDRHVLLFRCPYIFWLQLFLTKHKLLTFPYSARSSCLGFLSARPIAACMSIVPLTQSWESVLHFVVTWLTRCVRIIVLVHRGSVVLRCEQCRIVFLSSLFENHNMHPWGLSSEVLVGLQSKNK